MGIKFHCPNGHKLNVKASLAGKKAVCPKCGEKLVVPEQSELSIASKRTSPAASHPQMAAPQSMAGTTSAPGPAVASAPVHEQPMSVQPALMPEPTFGMPRAQPVYAVVDPINEMPMAVWYVRPPSGGQFGPAAGDIMRGWLAEGRVTADSLVWRAGWPEWRSAASTFPQLFGGAATAVEPPGVTPIATAPAITAPVGPIKAGAAAVISPAMPTGIPIGQFAGMPSFDVSSSSEYEDPVAQTRRRGKKGADSTMVVSGILVALVIVLFIVLGFVLSRQGEVDEKPGTPKAKPKPAATSLEKPAQPAETGEPKVQPLKGEKSPEQSAESAALEAEMTK